MGSFRAIIIGAGPNGLLAALTLQRAGIDVLILEKRKETDLNWGSSVCLWPHSVRVLDQLGLLEDANDRYMPIRRKCNLRKDGSVISWSSMLETVGRYHGHNWMLFERGMLVEMLKNKLPDTNSQLHLNKLVTSISSGDDEVEATCSDGTTYRGSILIGADGINSTARSFVNDISGPRDDEESYADKSFTTTYTGIYGHGGHLSSELETGAVYETHSTGFSTQLIVPSPERYFFLIYERLPTATRKKHRFTSEHVERLVAEHADTYLAPGIKFKQVWGGSVWSRMAPLEEGVTNTWFRERVVLVGDSAHKMTPNLGFSLNSGWQSAVVLTNLLRQLVTHGSNPGKNAIASVFAKYDGLRHSTVIKDTDLSATATRVQAWDNFILRVADQYVLPYVGGDDALLRYLCSPLVRKGVTLDFLPEPNFKEGTISWSNKPILDGETR